MLSLFFVWGILFLLSKVPVLHFFHVLLFLQKPGGIIALLDEAWYVCICRNKHVTNYIYIYIICFKKVKFTKSQNHSTLVIRYFRNYCSMFPRSTHETFATKLYQTFKDHKRFSKPKLARTDFTICHYAGDVCIFCLLCN